MRAFPRWLIAAVTLAMLMLLSAGTWFYRSRRDHLRGEANAQLEAIAQLKAEEIANWRAERLGDAAFVSETPRLADAVARWMEDPGPEGAAELLGLFRSLQAHYRYSDLLLVDPDGGIRLSLRDRTDTLSATVRDTLRAALRDRRSTLTDLYISPDDGGSRLDGIAPLCVRRGDREVPIGAILLECDACEFLYPCVQSWPTSSRTAETLLVRRDGDAVLFLNDLRHRQATALTLRIPLSQSQVPAVLAVMGREGVVRGTDYRGVDVLSALRPIPDSPWFLVAKIDAREVFAGLRRESTLLLLLLLSLAVAAVAAAGVLWQRSGRLHSRARLAAEAARRTSEKRHHVTLLSIGDAVIATDADGRVELLNPVAEALSGWSSDEARGRVLEDVFRIVNEDTRTPVENPVRRVLREGAVVGLANHTVLVARDGTERAIADSGAPIRDEDGRITGIVLVFRDVAQDKRHAREREATLELMQRLNAPGESEDLIRDVTGLLQGWSGCEAVGVRLREGDDYPYFETRGFPAKFVEAENFLCARDLQGQRLRDDLGHPIHECMCGNVLHGRFDPRLPFFTAKGSFWSNCTTDLLATTTEADRQSRTRNRCNGEGYESVALIPLRCGGDIFGLMQLNDHEKGRFTPESIAFLESAADQIAMALAERKARVGLRASEDLYRSLFKNMLNGFAYCRMLFEGGRPVDFVYLSVNDAFEAQTGLKDVAGRRVSEVIPGIRESDPGLFEIYGRVAMTGTPERFETYVEALKMWFEISVYCPRREHFVAVFDGITERKRSEAALRQSQELLQRTLTAARAVAWEQDYRSGTLQEGGPVGALFGQPEGFRHLDLAAFLADIHPEDRARVQAAVEEGGRQGEDFAVEYRVLRADGSVRWLEASGRFDQDSMGVPIRVSGIARDVTEQRHARQALRDSEERFRTLFSRAPVGVALADPGGRFLEVNEAFCAMLGYLRDELLRLSILDITFPEDRPLATSMSASVLQGFSQGFEVEKRYLAKSGATVWVNVTTSAVRDPDGAFLYGIGVIEDVTERKRAAAERERLVTAIEQAAEVIVITDVRGVIQYVNPAFEAVTGYTREEAIGQNPRILKSGAQDPAFYRELWETLGSGRTWTGRFVNRRKDGTQYTEDATLSPVRDAAGTIVNYVAVKRDITRELHLEEQFLHAQKMESVGRLAGGVAHDFNNMLSVIMGHADLALDEPGLPAPVRSALTEIHNAATRSANLTRQLLAFARRQTIAPKVLDLNERVEGMLQILRRLIGENVNLVWKPEPGLWSVRVDPVQIDQILANVSVNARDAISGTGQVTIETRNVVIDEVYCAEHADTVPGEYALLVMSDNGGGMEQEVLAHIFEPFYTTKEVGQGTGLGLATVYGIVQQNQGFIHVYSEPGRGTTFKIHFPRYAGHPAATAAAVPAEPAPGGTETLLLVEDEAAILNLGQRMLQRLGYTVLAAGRPSEAILLASEHAGEIHLLVTDIVMPEMSGREMAAQLLSARPNLKHLFMSGHSASIIAPDGVLDEGVNFIEKPFSMSDLAIRVRQVLGPAQSSPRPSRLSDQASRR